LVLLVAGLPRPAAGDATLARWIDSQIQLEEGLLERARRSHEASRREQTEAEEGVRSLETRLDRELAAATPSLTQIQALQAALLDARGVATARARTADRIRQEVVDRFERLEVLRGLRPRLERRERDALSGRWTVRVLPQGLTGTMELELDGTIVGGTYELDGGFSGSLRGTFVRTHLILERIDAEQGFDVVYEGDLAASGDVIRGQWRATLLDRPGPPGGDWVAQRVRPTTEEEEEEENQR
jgi:hypothetical protein